MECASTLGDLDLKRLKEDSDGYETEVAHIGCTFDDLLHTKKSCEKNPQHTRFIPVRKFCIDHLPLPYRDDYVYKYVIALSKLTVQIEVAYTSLHRPDGYLYYKERGKRFVHLGSGVVDRIIPVDSFLSQDKCTCELCQSDQVQRKRWIIRVPTAKHLVFDTEEAKHAKVTLFLDEDKPDSSSLKVIHGHCVTESNLEGDWAFLDCVTHDKVLAQELHTKRQQLSELNRKINIDHRSKKDRFALIVSHPHGCSKQVSIGEWMDNKWYFGKDLQENLHGASENNAYTYNTPTCCGSSGAPVRIFGQGYFGSHDHTHSKGFGNHGKFNYSGIGWDSRP